MEEQQRLIHSLPAVHPISFCPGPYDSNRFYELTRGMENVPEGGERCFVCYEMRLREAAEMAKQLKLDDCTTALSIMPLKNEMCIRDRQITDHYAIIPTGQGLNNLRNLSELSAKVYETIVRRFLGIFYPPAVYQKVALVTEIGGVQFFSNFRVLVQEGYLKAMQYSFFRKKEEDDEGRKEDETTCEMCIRDRTRTQA